MLKITDPVKRDLIIKEYLKITKKIAAKRQKATEGIENLPPLGEASGEKEPIDLRCYQRLKSC